MPWIQDIQERDLPSLYNVCYGSANAEWIFYKRSGPSSLKEKGTGTSFRNGVPDFISSVHRRASEPQEKTGFLDALALRISYWLVLGFAR